MSARSKSNCYKCIGNVIFGNVFEKRRKPEFLVKNPSEQRREQKTNLTHIWRRRQDLNPGHTGGQVPSSAPRATSITCMYFVIFFFCSPQCLFTMDWNLTSVFHPFSKWYFLSCFSLWRAVTLGVECIKYLFLIWYACYGGSFLPNCFTSLPGAACSAPPWGG